MTDYKPTGYPRGRPRKGETRPLTKGAEKQRNYRKNHREHWLTRNRAYQEAWRDNNPERTKEIGKNYRLREKLIEQSGLTEIH